MALCLTFGYVILCFRLVASMYRQMKYRGVVWIALGSHEKTCNNILWGDMGQSSSEVNGAGKKTYESEPDRNR